MTCVERRWVSPLTITPNFSGLAAGPGPRVQGEMDKGPVIPKWGVLRRILPLRNRRIKALVAHLARKLAAALPAPLIVRHELWRWLLGQLVGYPSKIRPIRAVKRSSTTTFWAVRSPDTAPSIGCMFSPPIRSRRAFLSGLLLPGKACSVFIRPFSRGGRALGRRPAC